MEDSLRGKTALVTGAGKGLGRAIAQRLAGVCDKVYAISRTKADLDSLKAECPRIEPLLQDISDWEATRKLIESLEPVDLLVNNAGIIEQAGLLDSSREYIDSCSHQDDVGLLISWRSSLVGDTLAGCFEINIKAACNITQGIAKGMICRGNGGSIVNMSSSSSIKPIYTYSVYCMSKAALDMLTKATALELAPYKIRVNSVNPTAIMTPMGKKLWSTPEKYEQFRKGIPIGKMAEIEDIVNATIFLLSDQAAMITGVLLPVDGAISIG